MFNLRLFNFLILLCTFSIVEMSINSSSIAQENSTQVATDSLSLREKIKQRRENRQIEKQSSITQNKPENSIDKAGDYNFSIEHDGYKRLYKVHVPKKYNSQVASPMLIAFHGGGGDMNYQSNDEYYGLISKSEESNFIAVFPNGYSKLNSGKFATWNAGNCCATARDLQIDDVGFVKKIIRDINLKLNINQKQIFATGMSNGGMMSYRLACEMADTFKAIAAVAGTDNTIKCTPSQAISILHIHAKNDDHVNYLGGAGKNAADMSKITDFTSVPATIDKWVKHNTCEPKPSIIFKSDGATCEKYSSCMNKTEVQLCTTEDGGHSWPGGKKVRGKEATSKALSANDVMWNFFMRQ